MTQSPCPISAIAEILGRKWMLEIIYYLHERKRFNELQEALLGLNPRTLSKRLKTLEETGIVERIEYSSIPPHVVYVLTEKGHDLIPILHVMADWVRHWHPETVN